MMQERRLVEDDHVQLGHLQALDQLPHEVHLVVEELVGLHLVEEEHGDVEIFELPSDLPPGRGALRVCSVDRARDEKLLQLGLLGEEVHRFLSIRYGQKQGPCQTCIERPEEEQAVGPSQE